MARPLDPDRHWRQRAGLTLRGPSIPSIVFFALAVAFVVYLATAFDLDASAIWATLRDGDPVLILLATAVYYLTFLVRGVRWRLILTSVKVDDREPPSLMQCTQYVLLGRFADSVAWLRLGNFYRAYLATDSAQGSFPRTLGTLVAEHFLDIVVVFTAAGFVGLILIAQDVSAPVTVAIAVAFAAAAAGGAALLLMRGFGPALARHLPHRAADAYSHFHRGTLRGLDRRRAPALMALSYLGLALSAARWYLVARALDIPLDAPMVVFISIVNALLSAVPITPGGLGIVEPGVAGALTLAVSAEDAVSVALMERLISYVSIVIVGGLLLFAREVARRRGHRWQAADGD